MASPQAYHVPFGDSTPAGNAAPVWQQPPLPPILPELPRNPRFPEYPAPAAAAVPAEAVPAAAPALEPIGRLASGLLWQERITERYSLQDVARSWLCRGRTEDGKMPFDGLYGCCRFPHGSKDVPISRINGFYVPGTGRSYRVGLQHCGSSWIDPVCSGIKYDLAKTELKTALELHRGAGGKVLLITLTARHHHMPLAEFRAKFKAALRRLYAGRAFQGFKERFGYIGGVTGHEITYSRLNGWHAHVHILWFCGELVPADIAAVQRYVDLKFRAALLKEGLDGSRRRATDVRDSSLTADEYVAKFDHDRKWDADAELTMGARKHGKRRGLSPWDLLRIGAGTLQDAPLSVDVAEVLYREYAAATAGDHALYWSKGLREHFELGVEPADDEPAGDDPDEHEADIDETEGQGAGVMIDSLSIPAWHVVLQNACRAELAIVEASGDPRTVKAFLELLDLRCELVAGVVMAEGP